MYDNSPSPNSQSDIDIRNKALHLLQQADPHQKVNVSYAQQARRQSATFVPQSYQNSNEALEREREANRRYSYPSSRPEGDDLVDLLMPVVSCVSHACRVGISGIAQQAAQGVSMMRREAEERIFTGHTTNEMRGSFESVGIPTSYQGKYSDVPEAGRSSAMSPSNGENADIMSC